MPAKGWKYSDEERKIVYANRKHSEETKVKIKKSTNAEEYKLRRREAFFGGCKPAEVIRKISKTHCPKGHEFTKENTLFNKLGHRKCRECDLENKRAYRKNHSEKCKKEVSKSWHKNKHKYAEKILEGNYRRRYGITLEQYNKMFEEQSGCCYVCGKNQSEFKNRLCVDHNHHDGSIRKLLCVICNTKVGYIEKSAVGIEEVIKYYINGNNGDVFIKSEKTRLKYKDKEYDGILEAQGGCCAICKKVQSKTYNLDHCHKTGLVRGLLCDFCNLFVGVIENYDYNKFIDYLENHKPKEEVSNEC